MTKKIKKITITQYGGYGCWGYKMKYTLKDTGLIKIKESITEDAQIVLEDPIDIKITRKNVIPNILSKIEEKVLPSLINPDFLDIVDIVLDAGSITIDIKFSDGSSFKLEKTSLSKNIELLLDILNNIEINHKSFHGYYVQYLVRSPHTLDQKLLKTAVFGTKETALRVYSEEAEKYVVMGIMRLYQAEMVTVYRLSEKQISKELIISNAANFWNEQYGSKML